MAVTGGQAGGLLSGDLAVATSNRCKNPLYNSMPWRLFQPDITVIMEDDWLTVST